MAIKNPTVNKIFNDLDAYRDFCRLEGKVYNEADLYRGQSPVWQQYQKYQGWLRAKARGNFRRG